MSYQLDRIEARLAHLHVMVHAIFDATVTDPAARAALAAKLKASNDALEAAEIAANPSIRRMTVANPIIDALTAEVARAQQVEASTIVLINGIASRIDLAVAAALKGGVTAAELAPLADLSAALKSEDDALAAAVLQNTPAAPVPTGP